MSTTRNKLLNKLNGASRRSIAIHRIPEPPKPKPAKDGMAVPMSYEEGRPTVYFRVKSAPFLEKLKHGDDVTIAFTARVCGVSSHESTNSKGELEIHGSVDLELYEVAEL